MARCQGARGIRAALQLRGLSPPPCTRGRTVQPELPEHFSPRAWSATWFPAFITAHLWPLFQVAKTEMMRLFSWFVWVAIVLTRTIRLQNMALFYRVHILFIAINNNLILTTQRFHTILYTAGKLKFSCRWAAFGNKPKYPHSAAGLCLTLSHCTSPPQWVSRAKACIKVLGKA